MEGGERLGSATQMLFASSISELRAMCVCVCVSFLFLNHCTEADCFILFQQVPLKCTLGNFWSVHVHEQVYNVFHCYSGGNHVHVFVLENTSTFTEAC